MPRPLRILPAAAAALALGLAGCGGSGDGVSCDDVVCTVQSDGPGTYTLDQQRTEVEVSDLTDDAVRVRVNSEEQTVRRGADPARIRGYLVAAEETSPDRVKIRLER
ncbi:unannotated protein [freshwater metagenome]|uniref:Unannotated protein n=1 Tax=freshwater metagenome TaxID=449393 RepID=A0A6J7H4B5_9ZZZZ|nr:hypothetical protein [Actinomycetota bacterium]